MLVWCHLCQHKAYDRITECSYNMINRDYIQSLEWSFKFSTNTHTHIWKRSRAKLCKASQLWTLCCAVDSGTTVPLWSREADSLCCTHVDILQRQQQCYSLFNRLSHTITQRTMWNSITYTSFEIKTKQDNTFHVNSWRYSSIMYYVTISIVYTQSLRQRKTKRTMGNYFVSCLFLSLAVNVNYENQNVHVSSSQSSWVTKAPY